MRSSKGSINALVVLNGENNILITCSVTFGNFNNYVLMSCFDTLKLCCIIPHDFDDFQVMKL